MRLVRGIVFVALIVVGEELAEEPGSAVNNRGLHVVIENQSTQEFQRRTAVDRMLQHQAGTGKFLGAPLDTGERYLIADQMIIPLRVAPGRTSKSFECDAFENTDSNIWRRSCYGR